MFAVISWLTTGIRPSLCPCLCPPACPSNLPPMHSLSRSSCHRNSMVWSLLIIFILVAILKLPVWQTQETDTFHFLCELPCQGAPAHGQGTLSQILCTSSEVRGANKQSWESQTGQGIKGGVSSLVLLTPGSYNCLTCTFIFKEAENIWGCVAGAISGWIEPLLSLSLKWLLRTAEDHWWIFRGVRSYRHHTHLYSSKKKVKKGSLCLAFMNGSFFLSLLSKSQ